MCDRPIAFFGSRNKKKRTLFSKERCTKEDNCVKAIMARRGSGVAPCVPFQLALFVAVCMQTCALEELHTSFAESEHDLVAAMNRGIRSAFYLTLAREMQYFTHHRARKMKPPLALLLTCFCNNFHLM